MFQFCSTAIILSACLSFAQAATNLSGGWVFTHADDRFRGTIVLRQAGSGITGTWHNSKGKTEADSPIAGRVDGNAITLTRFIGDNRQNYALTLSADGNRLDGFGGGWFLSHTNLNMQRVAAKASSARTPSAQASSTRASSAKTETSAITQKSTAASASSAQTTTPPTEQKAKQKWMGIGLPPPRGTWTWEIQSVAQRRGSEIKYSSFYYEASTDRSVEQPLALPAGATIVGVFPDDCAFSVRDALGHFFTFRNEDEAKAKELGPETWSVYPLKCGGVNIFLRQP
jgi:hypothetical protein